MTSLRIRTVYVSVQGTVTTEMLLECCAERKRGRSSFDVTRVRSLAASLKVVKKTKRPFKYYISWKGERGDLASAHFF